MRSRKKEGVYFMSILKRQVLFVLFAFAATLCAFAQNKTITGLVVDGNGESIIGASVLVKGTTNGIITDIDGKFTLNDVPEAGVIQISYIGYKTQEISAKNKANLKVVLVEDNEMLDEVVVVGYGVQKKSDVTGAMIRVGSEELNSRPVANAFEAMQGKAAGVDIVSNERPGEVGTINVRGVRSLSASNTPLYVVDGIPLMSNSGIETLNPQDIESIDVLKDASATAIYGSRGANGVILVTTKSGKEGKMSLNYSGTVTIENLQDYSEMMNSAEYIDWRRWAYYYKEPNKYPRGDQPTKDSDYLIFNGAKDPYAWRNIEKGWAGGSWNGAAVPTTDWADMVTQTGITHEHTLSASGGSEKVKGYASIGYLNNEGTVKGQSYTRYTAKVSLDMDPTKWFKMGLNINGTFSNQQYGSSAQAVGQMVKDRPSNLYAASTSLYPYAVPYDDEGNRIDYPGGDDKVKTIVDEWNYSENERRMFRAIGSLYAQLDLGEIYSPLKGLRYRFNFGPDFRYYRNGSFQDAKSVSREGTNRAKLSNSSDFSWTLDNLIYYDREIGKHSFGVTLLQSATKYHYEESSMAAINIPLPSAKWNALSKKNISALDDWSSGLTEKQLLSYMFRLNYDYNNKYLLTVSGRWDGASQLAQGNKWAFFPSAALGWRLDQEGFLQDVSWINQLKLRVGVGVTGNSAIDPYQTKGAVVPVYYPFGASPTPGFVASESIAKDGNVAMANKDLTWEKTTQYNIGVDYSVLNGRISGVLDFYTSRTTDLLMEMTIPSLNGYTNTYANVGKTSNIGIDLTLNTVNVKTRSFEWSTSINAAWQKDKIDELANGKEDDINNSWFIGQALGVIYGYQSAGIWKEEDAAEMAKFNAKGHSFQAGMARPVDQNGDYKIDPNDDRVVIGHTRPRWTFGMTNTFSYKNFDLSVMLYGRFDYMVDTGGEWQGGRYTQRKINYYNENNKNAEYQKPIHDDGGGDPYYQILGYKNGSFLKVRNISLGYTFPQTLVKKWNLSNLKVYVQAKNPGRIFSNIDFLELDASQNLTSTWNRGFTIGLNVGF
ncbi:SusC/RagA family TonB-linked outer membrane protein [Bacteroides stercoris]|uniref:TonB-dependent receptor plug domain protein n=1 Tax=Bacteroides stercoris TaxID=46506 RepID=A0A108TAW2_BACSE|nr:TonB-dependent receptor [Bacteroides stercoris]KWR56508.1 TonB-dependent receptor plug domain protein [Bacteroides stercoris]